MEGFVIADRPQRMDQHKSGDLAEGAVSKVCLLAGCAADKPTDSGEDLLVQSWLRNRLDDSRVWLQTKGHRGTPGKPRPRKRYIPRALMCRWLASADLVTVVSWDVTNDVGWYAIPSNMFSQDDLPVTASGNVCISFEEDRVLDVKGIEEVAWTSRLRHVHRSGADPVAMGQIYANDASNAWLRYSVEASNRAADLLYILDVLAPLPRSRHSTTSPCVRLTSTSLQWMTP